MHAIMSKIRELKGKIEQELVRVARELRLPADLTAETAEMQRLPVVNF